MEQRFKPLSGAADSMPRQLAEAFLETQKANSQLTAENRRLQEQNRLLVTVVTQFPEMARATAIDLNLEQIATRARARMIARREAAYNSFGAKTGRFLSSALVKATDKIGTFAARVLELYAQNPQDPFLIDSAPTYHPDCKIK